MPIKSRFAACAPVAEHEKIGVHACNEKAVQIQSVVGNTNRPISPVDLEWVEISDQQLENEVNTCAVAYFSSAFSRDSETSCEQRQWVDVQDQRPEKVMITSTASNASLASLDDLETSCEEIDWTEMLEEQQREGGLTSAKANYSPASSSESEDSCEKIDWIGMLEDQQKKEVLHPAEANDTPASLKKESSPSDEKNQQFEIREKESIPPPIADHSPPSSIKETHPNGKVHNILTTEMSLPVLHNRIELTMSASFGAFMLNDLESVLKKKVEASLERQTSPPRDLENLNMWLAENERDMADMLALMSYRRRLEDQGFFQDRRMDAICPGIEYTTDFLLECMRYDAYGRNPILDLQKMFKKGRKQWPI